ncbi:hypothetical protein SAMN00790413_06224 [Deinococcus hopiensis KR-140]|uniref:Uncharacterized protein n=1 Tax=Deinococcus hopiensis KR-140 TaxID=695939 RepID=A0A1W1VU92_9DEIO|nr:hypothetical protein SAMN00790413_06224 [Deinococcus hopiensis KR-140]
MTVEAQELMTVPSKTSQDAPSFSAARNGATTTRWSRVDASRTVRISISFLQLEPSG